MRPFMPEPHPQPVRCTRVMEADGWDLKVYESASQRPRPRRELVEAGKRLVHRLPQPPKGDGRHGVGFMYIYDGEEGCLALVGWWAEEDRLRHLVYTAPSDRPAALEPISPGAAGIPGWHLPLFAFERRAWLEAASTGGEPDLERYLETQLNAEG